MLIPTLSMYEIPNLTWAHAQNSLDQIIWDKNKPIVLNILHVQQQDDLLFFLDQLRDYLAEKNIHPKTPYPIYIQTDIIKYSPDFIIISEQYQNRYFLHRSSHSKGKENAILKKISILKQAILNHPIAQIHDELKEYSHKSKKLKDLCSANNFYNKVVTTWDKIR